MDTLAALDLEVLDDATMATIDGGCPLLDWLRGILFPIDTPECTCGECGAAN
jgi:hypothetical protein